MNKKFAQVLKAETSVQALRAELQVAEAENRGQSGELSQADRQVRDLHSNLGRVERDQLDYCYEMRVVESESDKLRTVLKDASEERDALKDALRQSEADQLKGQNMIAEMGVMQDRERERRNARSAELALRHKQLAEARESSEELREATGRFKHEESSLRMELMAASDYAQLQCEELAVVRCEFSDAHNRSLETSKHVDELRQKVIALERAGQQVRANLSNAEVTEQANRACRLQLNMLSTEKRFLKQKITEMEAESSNLEGRILRLRSEDKETEERIESTREIRAATEVELLEHNQGEMEKHAEVLAAEDECKRFQDARGVIDEDGAERKAKLQSELSEERKRIEAMHERIHASEEQTEAIEDKWDACEEECMARKILVEEAEKEAEDIQAATRALELRAEQNAACSLC